MALQTWGESGPHYDPNGQHQNEYGTYAKTKRQSVPPGTAGRVSRHLASLLICQVPSLDHSLHFSETSGHECKVSTMDHRLQRLVHRVFYLVARTNRASSTPK